MRKHRQQYFSLSFSLSIVLGWQRHAVHVAYVQDHSLCLEWYIALGIQILDALTFLYSFCFNSFSSCVCIFVFFCSFLHSDRNSMRNFCTANTIRISSNLFCMHLTVCHGSLSMDIDNTNCAHVQELMREFTCCHSYDRNERSA